MEYFTSTLINLEIENFNEGTFFPSENEEGRNSFQLLLNHMIKSTIVESPGYLFNFGVIHVEEFLKNFTSILSYKDNILDLNERTKELYNFHLMNIYFTRALWFIKDNSVSVYFSSVSGNDKLPPQILKINKHYTCSNGEVKKIAFTHVEIKETAQWLEILVEHSIKISGERNLKPDQLDNLSLSPFNETTSLSRAFTYLDSVRKEPFLPAKIAGYISILEILCAVKGENTYKVAERVATILKDSIEDRIVIFEKVKKSYDYRSKYVHGSHIDYRNVEKIRELSCELDDIVRNILKKVVLKYPYLNYSNKRKEGLKSFEEVDKEFVKIVLGKLE